MRMRDLFPWNLRHRNIYLSSGKEIEVLILQGPSSCTHT